MLLERAPDGHLVNCRELLFLTTLIGSASSFK